MIRLRKIVRRKGRDQVTCMSVLGFQSGSYIITLSAPVRLTPIPPTRVVSRNTNTERSLGLKNQLGSGKTKKDE